MPTMRLPALAITFLSVIPVAALAAGDGPQNPHPKDPRVIDRAAPDLTGYRTVDTAITTRVSRAAPTATTAQPAYLGVSLEPGPSGKLRVALVEANSPAAKAGLQVGDLVEHLNGAKASEPHALGDVLRALNPGDKVAVEVFRHDKPMMLEAVLGATSRPLTATPPRVTLGFGTSDSPEGPRVNRLTPDSPAAAAGVRTNDVIVKIDNVDVSSPDRITAVIADRNPGDKVPLLIRRENQEVRIEVKLAAAEERNRNPGRWDERQLRIFTKDTYRLAVVMIEYPDVKHNQAVSSWDWEQALFSEGVYYGKSPTGQQVYGSMNDYFREQSCGKLRVTGRAFDWVTVNNKRADYTNNPNRFALLTEALDKLLAREGQDALNDFDGIHFVYAGTRVQTNRGGIYWPHRASMSHRGKRWAYFICPEGGGRMDSISVTTHEFGHMLGMPDLYARPESPGSEGLGVWCTMATGHGRDGKPLHFSAWCKEQMGWLKPTVIDPTVKQKLILAPIENSPNECFKVLVRPDGSEYLLLENRGKISFDRDLPAEGLLVWRVVDGRPVLEESHGISGPEGPGRYLGSIPYPSGSNNAFTPFTTPSSRSLKGGGRPVYLTNITRLPDGRVSFLIGYEMF
jgi:M6 family metalloprotease-like protein